MSEVSDQWTSVCVVFSPDLLVCFAGDVIFDRSTSHARCEAGVSAQRGLTYEEAVEEAGKATLRFREIEGHDPIVSRGNRGDWDILSHR